MAFEPFILNHTGKNWNIGKQNQQLLLITFKSVSKLFDNLFKIIIIIVTLRNKQDLQYSNEISVLIYKYKRKKSLKNHLLTNNLIIIAYERDIQNSLYKFITNISYFQQPVSKTQCWIRLVKGVAKWIPKLSTLKTPSHISTFILSLNSFSSPMASVFIWSTWLQINPSVTHVSFPIRNNGHH